MNSENETGLRVRLFGRFEAWRNGVPIKPEAWTQSKTQALFKILITQRGQAFTQDQLIEALYPELDPQRAASNVHARLSELRRVLEPRLKKGSSSTFILNVGRQAYCFSQDVALWLDTEEFARRVEAGRAAEQVGRWAAALNSYQQALDLYQGDYLPEDLYEEWASAPRERWRDLSVNALVRLAECRARLGQYSEAIEACKKAIATKPTLESVYRQQMLYQFIVGQSTEALQIYQLCAKILKADLDVEPSAETKKLHEEISRGNVTGIEEVYPKPSTVSVKHNLPSQVSSFIGREKEKIKIKWELAQTRLLTLTGAGGSGKTSLALQVASELLKEYPQGVWWVELAPLSDAALVAQAVATTLGVKEEPKRSLVESLTDFLRPQNLLLVIDNCEHLIKASAELIEKILLACPEVQVLATSREPLGILGETTWSMPTLSLPKPDEPLPPMKILLQYEGVSLFVERAIAHLPSFVLNYENAPTVVQICRQLDGMPLAIELAAARVKVLSAEPIAERLSDRFKLLTGGSRTAQPRQQTLKAAIDWGFDLLLDKEKTLFRRLSVFAGGFSIEVAEEVCTNIDLVGARSPRPYTETEIEKSEILDLLAQLVDKSFVFVERKDKQVRYRLLETMRQYSTERLSESGERTEIQHHHAIWCLTLAEKAALELNTPKQAEWFDRLEIEHDNLRIALGWFSESTNTEMGMRSALAIQRFWEVRGYWSEARFWLHHFLEKQEHQIAPPVRACALRAVGSFTRLQGDFSNAQALNQQALELSRQSGDKIGIAQALGNLGSFAWEQGNYAESQTYFEASLALSRELGDKSGIAGTLRNLAVNAFEQGDLEQARARFSEALALRRELGDTLNIAMTLGDLGVVIQHQNDFATARKHYEESLAIHRQMGFKRFVALSLHRLGSLAYMQADYERSRALHEESLAIRKELGDPTNCAWSLYHLGRAARGLKEFSVARAHYEESLRNFQKIGIKQGLLFNLRGLLTLETAQEKFEQAVRLAGASESFRESVGFVFPPNEQAEFEENIADIRAVLGEEAFSRLWAEGRAMTIEQVVAYALNSQTI
ncbi:tetratricopeptide repeat protein [Candidatus Acetothermia bacterium]|nr:tetratricopeptide repeat protein [Candidatus Acetothermia bacterium]